MASREGHLLDSLSFVHKDNLTPAPALLFHVSWQQHQSYYRGHFAKPHFFQALIAEVMIFGGNIESLIDFFSFTVWIFYGMSMVALLVLRKSKPDIARPYKVGTVSH